MSWLPGLPGDATLSAAIELRPGLREHLAAMLAELWHCGAVPPRVLELCRMRIAQLLGCHAELSARTPGAVSDEDLTLDTLARWPTSEAFDATERACLALAEQFVLDPHAITDEQVARVRDRVGDAGAVALTVGLSLFEGLARAQQVLGIVEPDHGELWT